MLWSFAVGFVVAAVLALIGLELHLRWDRARWIKRFPEAASSGTRRRRFESRADCRHADQHRHSAAIAFRSERPSRAECRIGD
jgi:hypothetical protein